MANWQFAFSTWLRNSVEFEARRGRGPGKVAGIPDSVPRFTKASQISLNALDARQRAREEAARAKAPAATALILPGGDPDAVD